MSLDAGDIPSRLTQLLSHEIEPPASGYEAMIPGLAPGPRNPAQRRWPRP